MQRSLGGTLIRNLGRNLIAGLRLALFLRVSPLSFRALPGDCAALVIFNLIAWLLGDIAREGVPGQLNLAALPVQLMQVPVLLFLAVLVAGVYRRRDLILLITVMWISADWLFELAATAIRWLTPFADLPGVGMPLFYIVYGTMAWGLLVMLRAVWLALGLRIPRFVTASVLVALTYAGFYYLMPRAQIWVPDGPDAGAESGNSIASEQIFHLQPALFADALDNLLPQRPGISDLYFVGVAPYGKEDVFLREMLSARSILEDRFDVDGRSVTLINNAKTLDSTPIATTTNLRATLGYLGELMDPEEDVLLLFLTSHGERNHELAFSLPPLDLQQIGRASCRERV